MTPAGDNKSTDAPEPANLQADIDSLLEGIDHTANRLHAKAASIPEHCGAATQVGTVPVGVEPSEPAPDPIKAIDHLDAQLAELTSELLEPQKPAPPPPPPAAAAPPPIAPPAPAPVAAAKPVPAPLPQPAVSAAESAALSEAPATRHEYGPVFRVFEYLSRPLLSKPPSVRAVVALFAINSAIIAFVLWSFLLLRPPPAPPHGPAFNLTSDTLPRPIEPAATHAPAPAKDAHAKPDPKASTKADPKKAAAKPSSGH
jgi:hypothetical protein